MALNNELIQIFRSIIGDTYVFTDEENIEKYSFDETEKLKFPPEVVLKPRTAEEVSKISKICNQYLIPVTPRGGGTGLSGGALACNGGVMLSMERFNSIIEIDEQNLQVVTEPGVITEVLQNAVKEKGLFYPPDPASKGSCFIGGNIAENSGGPKAVKYGVVKDYVLNLEVVLPTGEIIWTGANVLKNVTGYNLTQLFVGSEGTLGVVTKIVLKLIPLPKYELVMLAVFSSVQQTCDAITAIFRSGITPSGLELMERDGVKLASEFIGHCIAPFHESVGAQLVIELDGNYPEILMKEMEHVNVVLGQNGVLQTFLGETAAQCDELWKLRRRVAEIAKASGYTIEEDTVVPRANLAKLITAIKALGEKHGFDSVCHGHAGDGNLHVRIKMEGQENSWQNENVRIILLELFELVKSLGGTITAEHGVGLVQKDFLSVVYTEKQIQLLRDIKKVFDPNGIMNPGKIFD